MNRYSPDTIEQALLEYKQVYGNLSMPINTISIEERNGENETIPLGLILKEIRRGKLYCNTESERMRWKQPPLSITISPWRTTPIGSSDRERGRERISELLREACLLYLSMSGKGYNIHNNTGISPLLSIPQTYCLPTTLSTNPALSGYPLGRRLYGIRYRASFNQTLLRPFLEEVGVIPSLNQVCVC